MIPRYQKKMAKDQPSKKRKHTGQRISEEFLARIDRIAAKQKSSPRAVMEQLFEDGLPKLERIFGIEPEKPQK